MTAPAIAFDWLVPQPSFSSFSNRVDEFLAHYTISGILHQNSCQKSGLLKYQLNFFSRFAVQGRLWRG